MAKSSAERVENFRKRLKADPKKYLAYKEKDRKRKQEERSLLSLEQRLRERVKCLDRVRKHRLRKKQVSQKPQANAAYKTPQSLGKAYMRAKKALPFSPRKQKAVVSKLAKAIGFEKNSSRSGNKKLPDATIKQVKKYFVRDDVSRQAPGMKDFVSVRDGERKQKLQKRHLTCSLKETYSLFRKDHPNTQISFSMFCTLRPPNVKLSSSIPRNVCVCQYHDNVKLLCEALHKAIPQFPLYSGETVGYFVCSSEKEECMAGQCSTCPDWAEDLRESASLDESVEWFQWERITKVIPGKKGKSSKTKKKIEKIVKSGSLEDLLTALEKKIPAFLNHVFVKRKQSSWFENKKSSLNPNEVIVHVDFSENYTCRYQVEVQSAHWDQEQVTVFPVVIWSNTKCESHAIISDDLGHDKKSVAVFMNKVLTEFVSAAHPGVTTVHIFSDGPSSQFKNKFMVKLLHVLQNTGLSLKWHYFATSHGKGAVDGVGGTVKRAVWQAVSTRRVPVVKDAKSFVYTATQVCKLATSVSLVTKEEIMDKYPAFNLKAASPIPGISKVHCVEFGDGVDLILKKYSTQTEGYEIRSTHEAFETDSECDDEDEDEEEEEDESEEEEEEEEDSETDLVSSGDEEKEECTDERRESSDEECYGPYINLGLPHDFVQKMVVSESFVFPSYLEMLLNALLSEEVSFKGSPLISPQDLKELSGRGLKSSDKWLSNFVIDAYLQIVSQAAQTNVKALTWEVFHSYSTEQLADKLGGQIGFKNYDCILIPCNHGQSHHWFLLALFPKLEFAVTVDSAASTCIKPAITAAMEKCWRVISLLTTSEAHWKYFTNTQDDVPQQDNGFDCGVFVCSYARGLALKDPLLLPSHLLAFRKMMIVDLNQKRVSPIPPLQLKEDAYYAVDYVTKYYIGRVLKKEESMLKIKFLFSMQQNGTTMFDWPIRADIDEVHPSCIFYGPLTLSGCGPFQVSDTKEIAQLFSYIRKCRGAR